MKSRWVIPAATVSAALIWPGNAHARTFTCWQSNTANWPMEQPDADANAGKWPTWTDCEAWRNGNPGPEYVWSYGPSVTTTTSEPATTTTETSTTTTSTTTTSTTTTSTTTTTTTTVPETPPKTTALEVTTTTAPATTTTSTTPAYHDATSTTQDKTTQTTATNASTTSTSSSTTTLPFDPLPETIPSTTIVQTDTAEAHAAKVIGAQLAPGVTPLQAESVLIVNVAMTAVSTATRARRRNEE